MPSWQAPQPHHTLTHSLAAACLLMPAAAAAAALQEDPFNAIMAGALTGGFLQLRSGLRPAFRSAVFGGALLVRRHTAAGNGLLSVVGVALHCSTAEAAARFITCVAMGWQ
jgi:hypothetical protein